MIHQFTDCEVALDVRRLPLVSRGIVCSAGRINQRECFTEVREMSSVPALHEKPLATSWRHGSRPEGCCVGGKIKCAVRRDNRPADERMLDAACELPAGDIHRK